MRKDTFEHEMSGGELMNLSGRQVDLLKSLAIALRPTHEGEKFKFLVANSNRENFFNILEGKTIDLQGIKELRNEEKE